MFTTETQIRVRYAETDQMGVVYHSNYFPYFEVARAESIRQLGFTYADMEKMGVIMPVIEVQCRYLRHGERHYWPVAITWDEGEAEPVLVSWTVTWTDRWGRWWKTTNSQSPPASIGDLGPVDPEWKQRASLIRSPHT